MTLSTYNLYFFFFNDTATTEIYTLSLHDALPIYLHDPLQGHAGEPRGDRLPAADGLRPQRRRGPRAHALGEVHDRQRSEEHTSELQSPCNLVCRLLLEKKHNSRSRNHMSACHHTH